MIELSDEEIEEQREWMRTMLEWQVGGEWTDYVSDPPAPHEPRKGLQATFDDGTTKLEVKACPHKFSDFGRSFYYYVVSIFGDVSGRIRGNLVIAHGHGGGDSKDVGAAYRNALEDWREQATQNLQRKHASKTIDDLKRGKARYEEAIANRDAPPEPDNNEPTPEPEAAQVELL